MCITVSPFSGDSSPTIQYALPIDCEMSDAMNGTRQFMADGQLLNYFYSPFHVDSDKSVLQCRVLLAPHNN